MRTIYALLLSFSLVQNVSSQDLDQFWGIYTKDQSLSQNISGLSFGCLVSDVFQGYGTGWNKGIGFYKSFEGDGLFGVEANINFVVYAFFLGVSTQVISDFSRTNLIFQPSFGINSLYFNGNSKFLDTFFFSLYIGRNVFINDSFKSHFNFWSPTLLFGINLKKIDR